VFGCDERFGHLGSHSEEMRPAIVAMDSWAGRTEEPVTVIGETPKRYRVRFHRRGFVGGNRRHEAGEVGLVPKYAVRFTDEEVRP